jgi:hypothetical protein
MFIVADYNSDEYFGPFASRKEADAAVNTILRWHFRDEGFTEEQLRDEIAYMQDDFSVRELRGGVEDLLEKEIQQLQGRIASLKKDKKRLNSTNKVVKNGRK